MRSNYIKSILIILCLTFVLAHPSTTRAVDVLRDVGDEGEFKKTPLILPFAFYSESFALALGVGAGASGYQKGQMGLYGAVLGTTNETAGLYLLGTDIQIPGFDRLFATYTGILARYTEQQYYGRENLSGSAARPGSNDSDKDDFIFGLSYDYLLEIEFKYVLPIGHARDKSINTYWLDRGLMVRGETGGDVWNPLTSGRTYLSVTPFYRYQDLEVSDDDKRINATNGLEFTIEHENLDYDRSPTKGSFQRLTLARDFGLLDSSDTWTTIECEFGKYFDLGKTKRFRQRVLAFNFWTIDTPTWKVEDTPDGPKIHHDPPLYRGASLGGYDRLKGYPTDRFHDKSAIYYNAELRVIPEWNPWRNISWLDFFQIDWWQIVAFVEAGRVAENWDLKELHTDMKSDVGIGIRLMTMKSVVRLDAAFSDETFAVWAMVGQSF